MCVHGGGGGLHLDWAKTAAGVSAGADLKERSRKRVPGGVRKS